MTKEALLRFTVFSCFKTVRNLDTTWNFAGSITRVSTHEHQHWQHCLCTQSLIKRKFFNNSDHVSSSLFCFITKMSALNHWLETNEWVFIKRNKNGVISFWSYKVCVSFLCLTFTEQSYNLFRLSSSSAPATDSRWGPKIIVTVEVREELQVTGVVMFYAEVSNEVWSRRTQLNSTNGS